MAKGTSEASAEIWRDRVQRWKQSGLTAKEFSQREGIARPAALSWWQHHLKQKSKTAAPEAAPTLQLVRLDPKRTRAKRKDAPERIEVVAGGFRVLVGESFNDATLRRVLAALEGLS
jgi:transposase